MSCSHDFSAGPNCLDCGLHAATVDGGSLSPRRITEVLKSGGLVKIERGGNPEPSNDIHRAVGEIRAGRKSYAP